MFDIFKRKKQLKAASSEIEKLNALIIDLGAKLFSLQKTINSTLSDKEIIDTVRKANIKLCQQLVELEEKESALKETVKEYSRIIIAEQDKIRKRAGEFYRQENKYKKQIDKMSERLKLETFMTYIEKVAEGVTQEPKKYPTKLKIGKTKVEAYLDKAINKQIKKNKNGNSK